MCYNKREFTLIYEKERGNGIMHILKKVIAAVAAAAFAASAIVLLLLSQTPKTI